MNLPKLTTPTGLFDYLIGLLITLTVLFGLYLTAVAMDVIPPLL
ncbi:hypothetical protein [Haladaptatus salinisoli]|nr:hypothetical protein [Haladaptatus salinisoli]